MRSERECFQIEEAGRSGPHGCISQERMELAGRRGLIRMSLHCRCRQSRRRCVASSRGRWSRLKRLCGSRGSRSTYATWLCGRKLAPTNRAAFDLGYLPLRSSATQRLLPSDDFGMAVLDVLPTPGRSLAFRPTCFDSLPDDAILMIFGFLDAYNLARCASVRAC